MSEWYEIEPSDIVVDRRREEVDLLVTNNGNGNVYAILTFKQILALAKKINQQQETN